MFDVSRDLSHDSVRVVFLGLLCAGDRVFVVESGYVSRCCIFVC